MATHRSFEGRRRLAAAAAPVGRRQPRDPVRLVPDPSKFPPRASHALDPQRMDIEKARFNMVEQQIRTWDVLDQDVLDLLFTVKREEFVPPAYRMLAFGDLELPLGDGEKMWTPKMEARVLQELRLKRGERVLEIGTGSGYLTALLAAHGAQVTSV